MIQGSFKNQSAGMQLMLLFMWVLFGIILFTGLSLVLVPVFFPVTFGDMFGMLQSGQLDIENSALLFMQGLTSVGTFLIPALLVAYLVSLHRFSFLGLNAFPKHAWVVVPALLVLTLSGSVISDSLYRLAKSIPWPDVLSELEIAIKSAEVASNEVIGSFLQMNTILDFFAVFFVMAILPGLGEELLFRGAMQPLMIRFTKSPHLGVLITSALFALVHLQFYTFLPILVLGIVLGYLRLWSQSIWPSVIVHIINNGSIVIGAYFFNMPLQDTGVSEPWDVTMAALGLLVFVISLAVLYKIFNVKE